MKNLRRGRGTKLRSAVSVVYTGALYFFRYKLERIMIKQKFLACVLILALMLPACSHSPNLSDATSMQSLPESDVLSVSDQETLPRTVEEVIERAEPIEETEYYTVFRYDSVKYYLIFDDNHDVARMEGPFGRSPRISMADEQLVKFTMQQGTGIATQWGYYYDVEKDVFSRVFHAIQDEYDGKVAYGATEKVIVRDIFDKTKYYLEINSFEEPFSRSVETIVNVEFVNDGTSIEVTYITGADYRKVSEVFNLY